MAEDAEGIGGIEVSAGIDDSKVDAQLRAFLGKLERAAKQAEGILSVTANVTPAAAAGPAQQQSARQQPAGPQTQLAPTRRREISEAEAYATMRANPARGATGADPARLNAAINAALEREAAKGDKFYAEANAHLAETRQAQRAQVVEQVGAQAGKDQVEPEIDDTQARRDIAAFAAFFREQIEAMQATATVRPEVAPANARERVDADVRERRRGARESVTAEARGLAEIDALDARAIEARGVRRKRLRDRAVGTEVDPNRIFTFEPDEQAEQRAEVAASRERDRLAAAQSRRIGGREQPTAAEAALLTNLFPEPDAATIAESRAIQQRQLQEMSYEAQQGRYNNPELTAGGFAPQLTPERQREREREMARRRALNNTPLAEDVRQRNEQTVLRQNQAGAQARAEAAQEIQQTTQAVTRRAAGAGGAVRESMEEFVERINTRSAEAVQRTLSSITAGGRTGQVAASGISATQFGTRAQQIRATEEQRAGRAIFAEAQKRLRINPQDVEAGQALENAAARVAAADRQLSNLQGFRATARNLGAIAIGALAFSRAMSAVDPILQAGVAALGDWIDLQAGFAAKSTAVTSALAQQTVAQKGNVDAVLAQQAATAGLSDETADYLEDQLKLTAQVKAGALAQQQASDLFRASIGLNRQAPQGLLGGFGGIGGSALFAQQLGGGKGFAEQVAGDFGAFQSATEDLRTPPGRGPNAPLRARQFLTTGQQQASELTTKEQQDQIARLAREREVYESDLNDAAKRGAEALGLTSRAVVRFGEITEDQARALQGTSLPEELKMLARDSQRALFDASGNLITTFDAATKGLEQFAVGRGIPDVATISRMALAQERQRQREARASIPALQEQFRYERPAFEAQLERQQQFALNTQLPAQQALANLASPFMPVGTGIIAANAQEQEHIRDATAETVELQERLNDYYDHGRQILIDTYQIPPQLINSIAAIGQQIASTQAGIRNQQAAYQVEQYNYQLRIARRTLADIGGLTGRNFGEGQSYLGVLEKQNLALSRQAQLLQFSMQQRQINFQVALAGFQAPGVTPEERQARVKEAEIEAGFAQKQLNIQREMFGNQVEIVDIQNLRQGADLAAQIGLLLQGRQLTINTAAAEEKLLRLQAIQQQQVAEAQTYIEKVNATVARAFGEITTLETAAGEAMIDASQYALDQFGITLDGMEAEFNSRIRGVTGTSEGMAGIVGGMMPESVRRELTLTLDTADAQEKLAAISEQQGVIAENVGKYLGETAKTVTATSRQVNRLEGAVGSALTRATAEQVNALATYFAAAAAMWSSFFVQVGQTAATQGSGGYRGDPGYAPRNAEGYVGMTTGATMTGVGVMGEAGTEAYAILRNPKPITELGDDGGGNITIIFQGQWQVRDDSDIDKLAQKVLAVTGREAALRGLRSVS